MSLLPIEVVESRRVALEAKSGYQWKKLDKNLEKFR